MLKVLATIEAVRDPEGMATLMFNYSNLQVGVSSNLILLLTCALLSCFGFFKHSKCPRPLIGPGAPPTCDERALLQCPRRARVVLLLSYVLTPSPPRQHVVGPGMGELDRAPASRGERGTA